MGIFGLLIILTVGWFLVGQPLAQLFLLYRKPRTKNVKTLALVGLAIHVIFLCVFGYSTTFEGAYNISGHGRYEEAPPYMFGSMFLLLTVSVIMFIVFLVAINASKQSS